MSIKLLSLFLFNNSTIPCAGPSCVHVDIDCAFGKGLMVIQNIPVEPMVQKVGVLNILFSKKKYKSKR